MGRWFGAGATGKAAGTGAARRWLAAAAAQAHLPAQASMAASSVSDNVSRMSARQHGLRMTRCGLRKEARAKGCSADSLWQH